MSVHISRSRLNDAPKDMDASSLPRGCLWVTIASPVEKCKTSDSSGGVKTLPLFSCSELRGRCFTFEASLTEAAGLAHHNLGECTMLIISQC